MLAVLLPTATAQQPQARSYFAGEYPTEFVADLERLREIGAWDGLASSLLAPVFAEFENNMGFALDDLREIRGAMQLPERQPQRPHPVIVMTGNSDVVLPSFEPTPGRRVESVEAGEQQLLRVRSAWRDDDPGTLYLSPKPGVLVFGPPANVSAIADGSHKAGVPTPEVLRHTESPGDLAHLATHLNAVMREDVFESMRDWFTNEDPVTFLLIRLHATGPEDEPTIAFEAMLQCERGTVGPDQLAAAIEKDLAALSTHRQFGALKRFWNKVEVTRDGREVWMRLPLGRPRRAAANLAQLIAPLLMVGSVEASAPVRAVPVPAKANANDKRK